MVNFTETPANIESLEIFLERDIFLRTLIRELAGTLQNVVGLEEVSGFISVVGQAMGQQIDRSYKSVLKVSQLSREQVTQVLLDSGEAVANDRMLALAKRLAARGCQAKNHG